jgi:L-proline amide hydrolase
MKGLAQRQGLAVSDLGQTSFTVVGESCAAAPLVVVHGGPGMTHDYLLDLAALAARRQVVFYDQIGNGRSQPVGQAAASRVSLSSMVEELEHLLHVLGFDETGYVLLGHSSGGCIVLEHALKHFEGLRGLILADAFPSASLMQQGMQQWRDALSPDARARLSLDATDPDYGQGPEFAAAIGEFFGRHVCRVPPPEHLLRTLAAAQQYPQVQHKLMGTNLFEWTGELKSWSATERLSQITVPTLAYGGAWDEASPQCLQTLGQGLANCTVINFENASHLPHIEETQACIAAIETFLLPL